MGILTVGEVFDRVSQMGGSLYLNGGRVRLELPDCPEADTLAETVRRNRDTIVVILRDSESKAPSAEEVRTVLPPGVRLVSYQPKQAPFAVAPVSIVTNAGKFYRAYLADLGAQLEKPEGHHCAPLADILAKLTDAGLELEFERHK